MHQIKNFVKIYSSIPLRTFSFHQPWKIKGYINKNITETLHKGFQTSHGNEKRNKKCYICIRILGPGKNSINLTGVATEVRSCHMTSTCQHEPR